MPLIRPLIVGVNSKLKLMEANGNRENDELFGLRITKSELPVRNAVSILSVSVPIFEMVNKPVSVWPAINGLKNTVSAEALICASPVTLSVIFNGVGEFDGELFFIKIFASYNPSTRLVASMLSFRMEVSPLKTVSE